MKGNGENIDGNTNVIRQTLYAKSCLSFSDFPKTLQPYVDVCCAASTTTCPPFDILSTGGDVHQIL